MSSIKLESNASGTGVFTIASPNSNTNRTLSIPDGTGSIVVNGVNGSLVSATAVASTSGTSIDFTGIPSWVKRITVMFSGVSTSGTSIPIVQIGDAGGFETSGYTGSVDLWQSSPSANAYGGSGYQVSDSWVNTYVFAGQLVLTHVSSNIWVGCFTGALTSSAILLNGSGTKTLSDPLTQLRITTVNGTDTFDAGTINILYE
jgi:hypothetical protein